MNEARIRQTLLALKDDLASRIERIRQTYRTRLDSDSAERAVEQENDEVRAALLQEATAEIADIHAAQRRLDDGTYGRCTHCNKTISPARLEAMPATPLCRDCARQ